MDQRKQSLTDWIRKLSYREGDFTLSSGKKSAFYIDLKATTLHPEGAHLIGELAAETLKSSSGQFAGVGGMTLGADPIATAISLAARARGWFWPALIVRKEPKSHGTSRFIEGIENVQSGSEILVVEDVATTGGSSLAAAERLREAGLKCSTVLAVVDREEGARESLEKSGLRLVSLLKLSEIRSHA